MPAAAAISTSSISALPPPSSSSLRHPSQRRILPSTRLSAIVGIDLGTTNSAVAYIGPNGPQCISDAAGNATFPSCITITDVRHALLQSIHFLTYIYMSTHFFFLTFHVNLE